MKSLTTKLVLNKTTIDILDTKELQNVKGGAQDVSGSCYMFSCYVTQQ